MPRKPNTTPTSSVKRDKIKPREIKNETEANMWNNISHQSSQYNSKYYDKLKADGRLYRFIEIITSCALANRTKVSTIDELNKAFYDYFDEGGLSEPTFNRMIKRYPDIANAWSARTNMSNANAFILKDGLMKMFTEGKLGYDQVFELMKYFDQGVFRRQNNPEYNPPKISTSSVRTESVQKIETNQTLSRESNDTFDSIKNQLDDLKNS